MKHHCSEAKLLGSVKIDLQNLVKIMLNERGRSRQGLLKTLEGCQLGKGARWEFCLQGICPLLLAREKSRLEHSHF